MALPSSATERELLRLKARVAELEAEVLHLKKPQSSSSEAEDQDSIIFDEDRLSGHEPTSPVGPDDACVMDTVMEFGEDRSSIGDPDDVAILSEVDLLPNMIEVETQEGEMTVDEGDDPKRYSQ